MVKTPKVQKGTVLPEGILVVPVVHGAFIVSEEKKHT
jgi:hypothetical protein